LPSEAVTVEVPLPLTIFCEDWSEIDNVLSLVYSYLGWDVEDVFVKYADGITDSVIAKVELIEL
jgi:hypothetical protein